MIVSVNKALSILLVLSDYMGSVPLKTIAERTGLNKGTCVRLLDTLIESGFVIKQDYGKYSLGPNAFYIGRHGNFRQNLINTCKPYVIALSEKYGDTVLVSIIENYKRYVLYYVEGEIKVYGADNQGGTMLRNGVWQSAAGRVIISEYRRDELLDFVRHSGLPDKWLGGEDIKGLEDIEHRFRKIRQEGHCIVDTIDGKSTGIAVPIKDSVSCRAALGYTYRINKYSKKELDEIIKDLKKAATDIGAQIEPFTD